MLVTAYQWEWLGVTAANEESFRTDHPHGARHHDRHWLPRCRRHLQGGADRTRANHGGVNLDHGPGNHAAAERLAKDGINVIGVPKTIDNDLRATDYSFGFDTAVNIATDAMDRLRTTGDSHQRCMVAEVMGRHVGWIALHAGMAAGAHVICIPEVPQSLVEITNLVSRAHDRGRAPLVVVSEGFTLTDMDEAFSDKGLDAFNRPRLGGIGEVLAPEIERITGIETRATVLGHIQRGGSPSGFDRVLATRLGLAAADAIVSEAWGQMVSLRGTDIVRVPFADALGELNTVPLYRYEEAAALFG